MPDGELHQFAIWFDLDGAACIALGLEFGHEFVAPPDDQSFRRFDLDDFAGICDAAVGEDDLPVRALLPFGLEMRSHPVLAGELGIDAVPAKASPPSS